MKNKEIKQLKGLKQLTNEELAKLFKMPYASFTNKLNQRDFKTSELITLAEYTNTQLAFIDKETKQAIIIFESEESKKDTE